MSNWYEFKKLYSTANPNRCIFKAYVLDKDTYRIIIDEHNLFTEIFLSIINGTYVISPLIYDGEKTCYDFIKINTNNAINNLQQYIDFISNDNVRKRFILKKANIHSVLSIRFKGPDFNFDQGMNPYSVNKANKIAYGISKVLTIEDKMKDQFIFNKAGSLIYDIHMPEYDSLNSVNYIKNILFNMNDGIIAKYDEFTYSLAKQLYEAVKIKNLDSITVELGDNSAIDINMDNIKKIYNEMRSEYITISGIPDTYSNKNKSFKIKKYSCYIQDYNDEIIKVIKELIENKIYVEVTGKRKPNHDNTIYITNITNDDINLSFSI